MPRMYWVLDGGAVPERAWQDTEQQRAVAYSALLVQVRILLGSRYTYMCAEAFAQTRQARWFRGGACMKKTWIEAARPRNDNLNESLEAGLLLVYSIRYTVRT